ncbi:hypothetical protein [Frisingicoccus sp.]|uniref:hypothetical protein n=1 Tax=Frisingicoccus sp. TaxID=1918627 RepID=UPI002E791DFA|nr:hypothetical protein [Frisingicoccus sp.]MEE0751161.1 hypothetical protein [Frisingicoccus sp.]
MFRVIKKQGKIVEAYRLGEESRMIRHLMEEGKIIEKGSGIFEVFSQEAVHGSGEIAYTGDFIKVDASGMPYPNTGGFFLKNHRRLGQDRYEQIPSVLLAWRSDQPMCEEMEFLIREKELKIDTENPETYYTAPLWGTRLSASETAMILFYKIDRDADGHIRDIDFNFVQRDEFDKTYRILESFEKVRLPEEETETEMILTVGERNSLLIFAPERWKQFLENLKGLTDIPEKVRNDTLRFFMRSSFFAEVDADRCIEIPEKLLAYLKKEGKIQGIYLYRAKEAADGFSPAMSRLKEILYSCASYVAVGEKIK